MDSENLKKLGELVASHGFVAAGVLKASMRLAHNLSAGDGDPGLATVFTGIPAADQAIAEAAGVAAIAGNEGVEVDDVIVFTRALVALGLTFV